MHASELSTAFSHLFTYTYMFMFMLYTLSYTNYSYITPAAALAAVVASTDSPRGVLNNLVLIIWVVIPLWASVAIRALSSVEFWVFLGLTNLSQLYSIQSVHLPHLCMPLIYFSPFPWSTVRYLVYQPISDEGLYVMINWLLRVWFYHSDLLSDL